MPHDPPSWILALPHSGPVRIPGDQKSGETQTGANISQLFLSASGFLYQLFFVDEASSPDELQILSGQLQQRRIDEIFCFE